MTGVQIHNWGAKFDDPSPNLEYVAPTRCAGQACWLAGLACHFLWHYCWFQDPPPVVIDYLRLSP